MRRPARPAYPCWTNILAQQGVLTGTCVALFGLYMAVFLMDELIIFGLVFGAAALLAAVLWHWVRSHKQPIGAPGG